MRDGRADGPEHGPAQRHHGRGQDDEDDHGIAGAGDGGRAIGRFARAEDPAGLRVRRDGRDHAQRGQQQELHDKRHRHHLRTRLLEAGEPLPQGERERRRHVDGEGKPGVHREHHAVRAAAEQRAEREPADRAGQRPADRPREPWRGRDSYARCRPHAWRDPRGRAATDGCNWRRRAHGASTAAASVTCTAAPGERAVLHGRRSGQLFVEARRTRPAETPPAPRALRELVPPARSARPSSGRKKSSCTRPTANSTWKVIDAAWAARRPNTTSSRHCAATSAQNTNAHASSTVSEVRRDAVKAPNRRAEAGDGQAEHHRLQRAERRREQHEHPARARRAAPTHEAAGRDRQHAEDAHVPPIREHAVPDEQPDDAHDDHRQRDRGSADRRRTPAPSGTKNCAFAYFLGIMTA